MVILCPAAQQKGMVTAMDANDLPLGFTFALAQNPDAMRSFSLMSEAEKSEILQRAHSVSSKSQMQALVNDLSARG